MDLFHPKSLPSWLELVGSYGPKLPQQSGPT